MTARPYTPAEIDRIRSLAADRRTDEEIGLLLGRGKRSIHTMRRRHGIPAGGGTYQHAPEVDPGLIDLIRQLAGGGWSDNRIGAQVDRSEKQIWRLRQRFGISAGNPTRRPEIEPCTLAANARRDAHIARLMEARAARQAGG